MHAPEIPEATAQAILAANHMVARPGELRRVRRLEVNDSGQLSVLTIAMNEWLGTEGAGPDDFAD